MESEVHEFTASLVGAPIAEKQTTSDACEDMLALTCPTNGISNLSASGVSLSFIDEEQDAMGDIQEAVSESQDGVETGDETEIIEKDDIIEEEYDGEEEEEDGADNEFIEECVDGEISSMQKECAQVPKKRKFEPTDGVSGENETVAAAAISIEEGEEEEEEENDALDNDNEGEFIEEDVVDNGDDEEEEEVLPDVSQNDDNEAGEEEVEEELPTSSTRAAANKECTVDEDICRVCTTKENLISLFKYIEQQTVADMLMIICPSVSIACKDFMPQYICQRCLDNVTTAIKLKSQFESTERELRKKLSRHKNKVRRPTGYVVIDAPVESEPEEEEEAADDVEFKVSDVEVSPSADESYTEEDSDFDDNNKKKRGGKRGGRKSTKKVVPRTLKRTANSSDDEQRIDISKKKKENNITGFNMHEFPCDECDQIFTRKVSLVLHKKTHTQSPPIICKLCGKHFKMQGSYRTHLQRHKNEPNQQSCGKCDLLFTTKGELRKHQVDVHENKNSTATIKTIKTSTVTTTTYKCKKCQRIFSSQARLHRHMEGCCQTNNNNNNNGQRPKRTEYESYTSGRDLFKAVAPPTTTYWSDSFSD